MIGGVLKNVYKENIFLWRSAILLHNKLETYSQLILIQYRITKDVKIDKECRSCRTLIGLVSFFLNESWFCFTLRHAKYLKSASCLNIYDYDVIFAIVLHYNDTKKTFKVATFFVFKILYGTPTTILFYAFLSMELPLIL